MVSLSQKIAAELENLDEIFKELLPHSNLSQLSLLELAGVAALLHNFYNGIENILKQILLSKKIILVESQSWHKDLLERATTEGIISEDRKSQMGRCGIQTFL